MEEQTYFCPWCEQVKPESEFASDEDAELPGICKKCNEIVKE
jgi:sarcosine oxidase delta subunit